MNWQAIQATAATHYGGANALGAVNGNARHIVTSQAMGNFGKIVSQGIDVVNQQLQVSQSHLQQLAVGNVDNLHQIMIGMEESRLSFQLFLQVRNRLLEAYQEVMKMQV